MKLKTIRFFLHLLSAILLLVSPVSLSGQNKAKADSLRALLKNAKGDTNEVIWLNALAKLTKSDIAEAEKILQRSIALAQKLKYKRGEAAAYNHLSAMVDRKGDFKLAIGYLQKSLEISKSIGDPVGQSNSLNYIARLYWIQADYDHALDALLHARDIAVQSKNVLLEANALNGMGNIYHSLQKDSLALDAYLQSLRAAEKIKDKGAITTACNNLGNLYHLMGKLDKSLEYHFRSLRVAEEQQDYFAIGPSLDNIGLVYEDQGKIEEALDCYNRSAGYSEKVGNQRGLIASNINIGNLYVKRKEYRKAEPYARKALALAKVFGGPIERREPSGQLSIICENTGRVAEAFAFYKQYVVLNDSVNNDEVARKSAETEMQFKYLKQTQADSIAQVKKDLSHAQELERETTRTEAQEKITIVFIVAFAIMLVLAVFIFRGYRQKQRANMEISQQKLVIEEQNKEIIDSITYARRIQRALLASDQLLTENLPEHFILYKPKDIVSGDFYWAAQTPGGQFMLLCGDCTGHGVPGAFMSLLGVSFLNEITIERKVTRPDEVLNQLRDEVIRALGSGEDTMRDGMDAVFCRFNFNTLQVQFACANNPIWLIRNGELKSFGLDKQPIGTHGGEQKPFTLHEMQLEKGDCLYLFTDGYADQFGGPKGKKFKYKQLQELLLSVHKQSADEQRRRLDETIENWKGGLEQLDDILIIGIKI